MSRKCYKLRGVSIVLLVGKYSGDLGKALKEFDSSFKLLDHIPSSELYMGYLSEGGRICTILVDPKETVIYGFGNDKRYINKKIDELLHATRIEEISTPPRDFAGMKELVESVAGIGGVSRRAKKNYN